jgi:hypothetical protein
MPTIVCGTAVPDHPNPHAEICHGFAYNWLIARGRLQAQPGIHATGGPFHAGAMQPVLWAAPKQPVRVAGVNRVSAGDLIGFFDARGALVHTMIAETPTTWVGANNQGCFGTGTGRTTIANIYSRRAPPVGWADGNSNKVQSMGGPVYAYFRTP